MLFPCLRRLADSFRELPGIQVACIIWKSSEKRWIEGVYVRGWGNVWVSGNSAKQYYFMRLSAGMVGSHLTHLSLLKTRFHLWKERNKPFLGALEQPMHSMAVSTMDLSAVLPVQRSLLWCIPWQTPQQKFAICTWSNSFQCCCIVIHREYLCLLDWELLRPHLLAPCLVHDKW